MKTRTKLCFLPIIIALLIFNSCKNIDIDKELTTIDSLNQVIEKTELLLKEINIENAKDFKEEIIIDLDFIKKHNTDTITLEFAKILNDYHSIKKSLSRFLDSEKYYKEEIEYSKEQLNNLKHDIEQAIITKEQFYKYYETELVYISNLEREISQSINVVKIKIATFNTTNPKIRKIVRKLKEEE